MIGRSIPQAFALELREDRFALDAQLFRQFIDPDAFCFLCQNSLQKTNSSTESLASAFMAPAVRRGLQLRQRRRRFRLESDYAFLRSAYLKWPALQATDRPDRPAPFR